MQMARALKVVLGSALLVAFGASTAHAVVTNVYYENFESWSNGVGIVAQDPTHWTNWTWTGDALVTGTLDTHSNATKALDVQGRDINLYFPVRLFDGVTSNSAATDDATHMQISMDVWLVQDDIFDFMISDYQRPPTNFDYCDHPGSGFEISGTGGYGQAGANGFYGAAGPHGNILTFISFGTYLGWGFDYFHKDYDPGAGGGAWHHVLMDMRLDPTSADNNGDLTLYTQWWLDGTYLFSGGYPSADRSYTGVPVAGSEGSNVWSGAYSKINANAVWGTGGVQSAEIFGWVGQSNVFVDNINIKQGNSLEIEPKLTNTCANYQTNAWLRLAPGSSWGASGVTWTYTNSAGLSTGLSNVNFSSTNYFYFNPSNSTPGTYVVTAQAVDNTNWCDVATVNVLRVDIADKADNILTNTQTHSVGEKISLKVKVTPVGLVVSTYQWTIPGTAVTNYIISADTNTAKVYPLTATHKTNSTIEFYWVDGSASRTVDVEVCVGGFACHHTVNFDIKRPSLEIFEAVTGPIGVGDPASNGWTEIYCGTPAQPGLLWTGRVTAAGFPGELQYTQLVKYDIQATDTNSATGSWKMSTYWLDDHNPYNGDYLSIAAGATEEVPNQDSPGQELVVGYKKMDIKAWQFELYLMFQPTSVVDRIWVPLGELKWGWKAVAESADGGQNWALTSGSQDTTNPVGVVTTDFPEWNDIRSPTNPPISFP